MWHVSVKTQLNTAGRIQSWAFLNEGERHIVIFNQIRRDEYDSY